MQFDPKIGKWNINPLISTPGTRGSGELLLPGLPVKTAPVENGPSPKRPHFQLKRPQFSVKTAPYQKSSVKTAPNRKVSVVFCEFSFNLKDLTSR